jgi:hypothetical protein
MIKYAISAVGDFNFFSIFLIFLFGIGLVYFIDLGYKVIKKKETKAVSKTPPDESNASLD